MSKLNIDNLKKGIAKFSAFVKPCFHIKDLVFHGIPRFESEVQILDGSKEKQRKFLETAPSMPTRNHVHFLETITSFHHHECLLDPKTVNKCIPKSSLALNHRSRTDC